MEEYAFEYDTAYTLKQIQVVDPQFEVYVVEHDGFGPEVQARAGPREYVFCPDGDEWKLNHTWLSVLLRKRAEEAT